MLKLEFERHPELSLKEVLQGLRITCLFQKRLRGSAFLSDPSPSVQSITRLYETVIQPMTDAARSFLRGLVKPFQTTLEIEGVGGGSDSEFLLFCAKILARLRFQRRDEVDTVLHAADAVLSRKTETLLDKCECFLVETRRLKTSPYVYAFCKRRRTRDLHHLKSRS